MGFGRTVLKYYSRLNIYKNSTDSCSFDPENEVGYSYVEKIIKVIEIDGQKVKLFNKFSFSVTTSSHQTALYKYYEDLSYAGCSVMVYSLNAIHDKKDLIDAILKNRDLYNVTTLKKIASQKTVDNYIKKIEEEEKARKRGIKYGKMRGRLEQCSYSPKTIVKKFDEYSKEENFYTLRRNISIMGESVDSFITLQNDKKCFDSVNISNILTLENEELETIEKICRVANTRALSHISDFREYRAALLKIKDNLIFLKYTDTQPTVRSWGNEADISLKDEVDKLARSLTIEIQWNEEDQKELDKYNNLSELFSA